MDKWGTSREKHVVFFTTCTPLTHSSPTDSLIEYHNKIFSKKGLLGAARRRITLRNYITQGNTEV
jgi:hypothetical protein